MDYDIDTDQRYYILSSSSKHELQELVNEYISKGFTPIGGVSIRHGSSYGAYFIQSVLRTRKSKF